jgi:hypothetical protein
VFKWQWAAFGRLLLLCLDKKWLKSNPSIDDETFGKILASLLGDFEDTRDLIPEYQIKGRGISGYRSRKTKDGCVKGGTKCYLLNYNYNNEKNICCIQQRIMLY